MLRIRPAQALAARQGVILLVVIALLTLFAVVGITFVIYAQAEASSMRAARQAENLSNPDADPEMLLNYFLSQYIYGAYNNPLSAMQTWDLATNIYGPPGGIIPFNGTGRFMSSPNFWNPNYGNGTNSGINWTQDGSPNPPYTYPDINCLSLAAVQASNGAVVIPSFYRYQNQGGSLQPMTFPSPYGYPNPVMRANLPFQPEDGFLDVKNLPASPGVVQPSGGFSPNDSIWMDLGFPVIRAANGQLYKPLFAALIQDLDNRVNVNMHGNALASQTTAPTSRSSQGWSPGEVNLSNNALPILNPGDAANIFLNNRAMPAGSTLNYGYQPNIPTPFAPAGHFYAPTNLNCTNTAGGSSLPAKNTNWGFPYFGVAGLMPSTLSPYNDGWWSGALGTGTDCALNPMLFNFFYPGMNYYQFGGPRATSDRIFPPSDLEALLRYEDTGSPSLTSDLFSLCPNSFSAKNNFKACRLLTTHSFDLSAPGVMPTTIPGVPQPPVPFAFTNANPLYPAGPQNVNSPAALSLLKRIDLNRGFVDYPAVSVTTPQFPPGYQLISTGSAMQNRQQMAQEIFNTLCAVTGVNVTFWYTPPPTPALAPQVKINVQPNDATGQYDAIRWLAQLAVNIVDFVNFSQQNPNQTSRGPDDVMTAFNWNPDQTSSINNGWVFGTVLPRLVINEAYIEIDNNPQELLNQMPKPYATMPYDVNCWVELHNPFTSDSGAGQANANQTVPTPLQGVAQLAVPVTPPTNPPQQLYPAYRVILAQNVNGGTAQATNMANKSNVLGLPKNIVTVVDQYTPDKINGTFPPPSGGSGSKANNQTAALSGNSLYQVLPNYQTGSPGSMQAGQPGQNKGFYVLGSSMAPFPGTATNPNTFASLPVKEQATQYAQNDTLLTGNLSSNMPLTQFQKTGNSMHYQFSSPTTPGTTLPTKGTALTVGQLGHTIALQRLACPYMKPDPNPGTVGNPNPTFNPYVTVDYILNVPTQMGVIYDAASTNLTPNYNTAVASWNSVGRNQPYAADGSQLVPQKSSNKPYPNPNGTPGGKSPQNTFFYPNAQGQAAFAYDWLFHANRPLVSPIELLQVSGYKPHQLTQMFMLGGPNQVFTPQPPNPANTGQAPTPLGKFQHRAPWLGTQATTTGTLTPGNTLIYRALEFFEAGLRPQWTAPGSRFPGKININTIWDFDTWNALCDAQPINFFFTNPKPGVIQPAVNDLYYGANGSKGLFLSRTPNQIPVINGNDTPFYGLAAPYATATTYTPQGSCGIQNTLLRTDANAAYLTANPQKLLLEPSISYPANNPPTSYPELSTSARNPSSTNGIGHPYLRMELLNKIFNNVTTRSNVFAVWLTVGFFEVTNDAHPGVPPDLGLEINKLEGRNIRHRMFAIIDRSNLTVAANPVAGAPQQNLVQPQPGMFLPGPRPFFINSLSAVTQAGNATISVPALCGQILPYEDANWAIQAQMPLVVDSGPNQEVVLVTGLGANSFTATFQNPHPAGFSISGACNWNPSMPVPVLGNPGPQTYFDVRNPEYSGVVRYFSIIE